MPINRKVIRNRIEINSGKIAERLKFDNVLQKHSLLYKPFYKTKWFLSSMISIGIIAVAGAALFFQNANETHNPFTEKSKNEAVPKQIETQYKSEENNTSDYSGDAIKNVQKEQKTGTLDFPIQESAEITPSLFPGEYNTYDNMLRGSMISNNENSLSTDKIMTEPRTVKPFEFLPKQNEAISNTPQTYGMGILPFKTQKADTPANNNSRKKRKSINKMNNQNRVSMGYRR